MRLRITAEIKGNIVLKNSILSHFYIYTFNVFKKDESLFLSIEKHITNYIDYIPQISVDKHNHTCISFPETTIFSDMVEWIKKIEAFGSFNHSIKRILYEEAEITWIPESFDEEKHLPVNSYKLEKTKTNNHTLTTSSFQDTLFYCTKLSENYIPFSYYRLGTSFFDMGEYYLSFLNYFMMLEFLFANGKTRKVAMKNEFIKSDILKLSILMTINNSPKDDPNLKWLQKECMSKSKPRYDYNVETIIDILIDYRGIIAHGNKNRSGEYYNDQQLLRPITMIIGVICRYICGYLQILSTINKEQKKEFLKERIDSISHQ